MQAERSDTNLISKLSRLQSLPLLLCEQRHTHTEAPLLSFDVCLCLAFHLLTKQQGIFCFPLRNTQQVTGLSFLEEIFLSPRLYCKL